MKKYFILAIFIVTLSCKDTETECCPPNPLQVTEEVIENSTDSDTVFENITKSIQESTNVERSIKVIVEKRDNLVKTNQQLKVELRSTKDSLVKVNFKLVETLKKVPITRNFLQRMLGTGKDSTNVVQIDTIQK